jgi:type VI secretion system protein ImpG
MRDELLTWYERELSYLRQLGAEFAVKYPKVAARLALEPEGSQDPHVERLIEAVAFLTARVRRKIEDDLPELTDAMFGILYPHYLAPVPSMAVVQFHLDPGQGQTTGGYEIPRHTELTARPVHGVRCRFRTGMRAELWPIEVAGAELEHPISTAPLGAARDFRARSLVRLRLRAIAGTTFATLRPAALRFFLHGESALTAGLYEMICAGPCQIELHAPRKSPERGPVVLARDAVTPVGFAADEALLPLPPHSFRGYGVLEEYFAFPEKFLFFDLAGLARAGETGATDELEVRIFSARAPRFDHGVQATTFRLGCAPVVNLFPKLAEPIWVDHTKAEYLVVPDVHGQRAHEVYSVDAATSSGTEPGSQRAFRAFYALRHGSDQSAPDVFWHATRRQALDGASDVHIALVDSTLGPASPPIETLSCQITCTNRDLAAELPFSGGVGADFDSEHIAPFVRVQCLNKPTLPRRRDVGRGAHWRLVSHLALNYLSLVEQGRDALQAILELYDVTDSAVTRRQIAGIRDVRSDRVVRNVGGAFCRGLKVTIDFDREHFVGTSPYLLAAVLDRFLGLYTSINAFSQLVARMPPEEEPLHTWPPRAGEQILL